MVQESQPGSNVNANKRGQAPFSQEDSLYLRRNPKEKVPVPFFILSPFLSFFKSNKGVLICQH